MGQKPNKGQHNRQMQKAHLAGLATLRFARLCGRRYKSLAVFVFIRKRERKVSNNVLFGYRSGQPNSKRSIGGFVFGATSKSKITATSVFYFGLLVSEHKAPLSLVALFS